MAQGAGPQGCCLWLPASYLQSSAHWVKGARGSLWPCQTTALLCLSPQTYWAAPQMIRARWRQQFLLFLTSSFAGVKSLRPQETRR